MEWIRISNNKLKIMLTAEDAAHYALQCEGADYADVMTRQAFREILTDVRQETGFDATEDKVYIQMYPSKEGGCELFVTKIGLLTTDQENKSHAQPTSSQNGRERRTKNGRRSGVFCFSETEALLAVCRQLFARRFGGESEAWQDHEGRLWLFLSENGNPLTMAQDYCFIREYGHAENVENARMYLPEHGHPICAEHAVETLHKL